MALAVAIVGVVGTLGAALLTQSRADRTKRHELQVVAEQYREDRRYAEHVRQAERAEAQRGSILDLRRACYISLNTASRQYQTAQVNLLYAIRNGTDVEAFVEQLEARRTTHRDSYAEAQMIVPVAVLAAAGASSRQLNRSYGTLKAMLVSSPRSDSPELDAFATDIETSWNLLSEMRSAMRRDLAIDDGDPLV